MIASYTATPINEVQAKTQVSLKPSHVETLLWKKHTLETSDKAPLVAHLLNVKKTNNIQLPLIENIEDEEDPLLSNEEKALLARLVHAEAKGEPYLGKVAVATVVLNRVEHAQFPDTLEEVVYQKNAFEPVSNGSIHEPANKEAHQAVEEALDDREKNNKFLYFYNPKTATSEWIFTRQVVKMIGNHAFAI